MSRANLLEWLKRKKVKNFIAETLSYQFKQYGLSPDIVIKTLKILTDNVDDEEKAVGTIYREVLKFYSPDPRSKFYEIYFESYKKKIKPKLYSKIIYKYIRGPLLVDIGAGDNSLALEILQKSHGDIKKVIGTDLIDYRKFTTPDSRIEFRLQTGSHIPVKNESANTALMIGVLHHVNKGQEKQLLLDVKRILKPRGRLIIVEDGYSEALHPQMANSFTKRFSNLSNQDKLYVMILIDWIGTRLILGSTEMNRPYNFKTLESWEKQIRTLGFKIITRNYLGLLKEKFSPDPQFLLIMQN